MEFSQHASGDIHFSDDNLIDKSLSAACASEPSGADPCLALVIVVSDKTLVQICSSHDLYSNSEGEAAPPACAEV